MSHFCHKYTKEVGRYNNEVFINIMIIEWKLKLKK